MTPRGGTVLAGRWQIMSSLCAACLTVGCLGLNDQEKELLVVHQQNSKVFYDQGDFARAIDTCRRGLELKKSDRTLRLTLAYSLLQTGNEAFVREADQILQDLEGWRSDDFRVQMGRGITQLTMSRMVDDTQLAQEHRSQARDYLERSIELEPDSAEAIFQLAVLALEQEHFPDFERRSAQALDLIRSSVRIKRRTLEMAEDPEQSRRTQRDLLVELRRGQELLRMRSALAYSEKRFEDALNDLQQMEDLGVMARSDYFNRARARERAGQMEAAVQDYVDFIEMSEDGNDTNVQVAVENLYELRARIAEQRVLERLDES